MIEWKEFESSGVGIRATINDLPCYVVPTRVYGWSWHVDPTGVRLQGYAQTQAAACFLAEQAANEVEA